MRTALLLAALALPMVTHAAAPEALGSTFTGDALVLQFLGPPEERKGIPKGDAYVDRERARGYMDGVKDLIEGSRWCNPGGAPHEIHADIIGAIAKLPPEKRNRPAAPLVAEAVARLFPCSISGEKP